VECNAVCFIGHRRFAGDEALIERLQCLIELLIVKEGASTFLFGSKSEFDALCLSAVTGLKEKHPHIRRIFVRAEYPVISPEYEAYLLDFYDGTYYPQRLAGAGKAAYVLRNREMIDRSRYCIFYYNEARLPQNRKSGTKLSLDYAKRLGKEVYVLS